MKIWLIGTFILSFLGYLITAIRLRSMEAYGKTAYMWKSSAEKEKFDLRMQLITIFASIGFYAFATWLFFLSNQNA